MKFTLIIPDKSMAIDGEGFLIDASPAPSGLHAVQWYETWGEEEWADNRGKMVRNENISSFKAHQWAIDAWNVAKAAAQAEEMAKQQAAQSGGTGAGPTVI
jgi:hypothetical protein